jgi:sulfur-carrier protein
MRSDSSPPGTAPTHTVRCDGWLREFGPKSSEKLRASSVDQLIDALEERYPRMRFKLRDETGTLRRYVRVFIDGADVSATTGLRTELVEPRTIDILHSIAGG